MAQLVIRTNDGNEVWINRDILHIPRIGETLCIGILFYKVIDIQYIYDDNGSNSYSIVVFANHL